MPGGSLNRYSLYMNGLSNDIASTVKQYADDKLLSLIAHNVKA